MRRFGIVGGVVEEEETSATRLERRGNGCFITVSVLVGKTSCDVCVRVEDLSVIAIVALSVGNPSR